MIYKPLCLGVIVCVSSAYSETSLDSGPVYSGPITLTRAGIEEVDSGDSSNPFIFNVKLDGAEEYANRSIVLKKGWESFSLDLDSVRAGTKTNSPYVRFKLINRQLKLHQNVYFWNSYDKGEVVFHTTDPDIPKDGKRRILQHGGKTIIGKQVIRFEKNDKKITVVFNGKKLMSFPKIDDFEYIEIGTKGLLVKATNLKINGHRY